MDMDNNSYKAILFGILGLVLIILIFAAGIYYNNRLYVMNGYQKVVVVGRETPIWQKVPMASLEEKRLVNQGQ